MASWQRTWQQQHSATSRGRRLKKRPKAKAEIERPDPAPNRNLNYASHLRPSVPPGRRKRQSAPTALRSAQVR